MGFFAKSGQNTPLRRKSLTLAALSAFVLLAGSSASPAEATLAVAERLFNAMLVNVQTLRTIEAGVRMDVYVAGAEYTARGKYEEQRLADPPPGDFQRSMYRLDLNFVMDASTLPGSEPNRMTIVCYPQSEREAGRLWQYTSIEGTKSVQYVQLARLEDAVRRANKQGIIGSVGETKNLGGLVGTLKQIARFYEFTDVTEGVELQPVWKITGSLRSEFHEAMIKAFGGLERKTKNFPRQMPTDIEISIGKDDAFPHRIEYRNRPKEGSPRRTVLTRIVYFDLSLDGEPIPEFKFTVFDQGNLPEGVHQVNDITPRVIRSLDSL